MNNAVFYLTGRCNLECAYCFGRISGWQREDTTEAVIKATVDWLLAQPGNLPLHIGFFGGEPLLRPDLLELTCSHGTELAKTVGRSLNYAVTTNLTLLTDEVAAMLKRYQVSIIASMDGLPHRDNQRYWPGTRQHSGGEALVGLLAAQRAGLNVDVRWTVSPQTIRYLGDDCLTLVALGFRRLAIEFVYECAWTPEQLVALEVELRAVAAQFIAELRAGREMHFKPFSDGFTQYTQDKPMTTRCGFGGAGVGVAPNGDILPCQRYVCRSDAAQWVLGNVFTGLEPGKREACLASWDREKVKVADGRSCRDCPIRLRCPGGVCPPLHLDTTGDLFTVPTSYCDVQLTVQRVANDVLGVLYAERNPAMLRVLGQKGNGCK